MKKILKNNQVLCIILCLLVIANAFVWTQTALNNRRREQLVGLTDRFEQQADEMREKNRRTLTTHLLTMDSFVDEVTPLFEENRIPDGVAAMIAFMRFIQVRPLPLLFGCALAVEFLHSHYKDCIHKIQVRKKTEEKPSLFSRKQSSPFRPEWRFFISPSSPGTTRFHTGSSPSSYRPGAYIHR